MELYIKGEILQMKSETKLLILFLITIVLFYFFPPAVQSETIDTPYIDWFQEVCALENIPLEIALGLAIVESNIQMINSEVNSNGSFDIGIMQINSRYVSYFEEQLWYRDLPFDVYDPEDNIRMGILILKHLYIETHEWDKAIRAYNRGLYKTKADPGAGRDYLNKIINVLSTLRIEKH